MWMSVEVFKLLNEKKSLILMWLEKKNQGSDSVAQS